jgi:hypothetical protein
LTDGVSEGVQPATQWGYATAQIFSQARRELGEALEKSRGCVVEVIMKDISTVRDEPRRLSEWAVMDAEVCAGFA